MKNWRAACIRTLFALALLSALPVFSQVPTPPPPPAADQVDIEALKKTAPKVFIDCGWCDIDYIRTEITFVNYVRDRREAQVHILITTLSTGSGGKEYTIAFLGQHNFQGIDDTLKYFSNKTDTDDEIRKGLVKTLKMGLMNYVAKTPIRDRMTVRFQDEPHLAAVKDKWNYWVFSISANGYFSGEESYTYRYVRGNFSANRVTPETKLKMSVSATYYKDTFIYENEKIESDTDSFTFNGLFVKSINDHWSVGGTLYLNSSTYENIRFSIAPAPAIEYNFFPYFQSTRRQLRFLYRMNFVTRRYREETIYFKTYENLWKEGLSVTLEVKEKWGTISTSLEGSNYLHDFNRNRLELWGELSLRIFKGFNFNIYGSGSRIRDQLNLAKGAGTSLEEVLLRRKQLATGYNYYFSVGLSYTFGSTSSRVVNPRFGNGSQSISISF